MQGQLSFLLFEAKVVPFEDARSTFGAVFLIFYKLSPRQKPQLIILMSRCMVLFQPANRACSGSLPRLFILSTKTCIGGRHLSNDSRLENGDCLTHLWVAGGCRWSSGRLALTFSRPFQLTHLFIGASVRFLPCCFYRTSTSFRFPSLFCPSCAFALTVRCVNIYSSFF